jgi:hypothetical protein
MSLTIAEDSVTYAPRFEAFAREISDRQPAEIKNDPVARSASLRQTADLIEPDWLVVYGVRQILAALPDREGRSLDEYAFGELSGDALDDLSELVQILSDVRSEPVVCVMPDPITMVAEVFGEEWTVLLSDRSFEYLDTLHLASQFLTDVIREFEGSVSGLITEGTHLPEALDEGIGLDDYSLEFGPLFNLADHYDLTVIATMPSDLRSHYDELADAFDIVVFESVEQPVMSDLPAGPDVIGCSFTESIWAAEGTSQFSQQMEDYFESLPSSVCLLTQEIPASVRPEHVREFGDLLDANF